MKDVVTPPDCADFLEAQGGFHFLAYPAHILVCTSDARGMCDFVSPSWTAFTGRDAASEMGEGWLDRVHAEDRATVQQGARAACQDRQPFRWLFRYQRADGAYRWLVKQGMPRIAPSGEFHGYIGLCFDVTTYQKGSAEDEHSAQLLISLLRQTRLIGVVLDQRGRIQFSNGGLCRLLRCKGAELMDCHLFEHHLSERDRPLLQKLYPDGVQDPHFPTEFETELVAHNGELRQVSWHAMVLRELSGRVQNIILIGDDITELRQEEAQLALGARIFDATNHAMLVTQLDGTIIAVNDAFTRLTGYSRQEALGHNPRLLQSGRHDTAFYRSLWTTLLATDHWSGDIWDRRKDGSMYPKYLSISTIRNAQGEASLFSGIFYDVSERKNVEERLDRLAHYDGLTGLPNRCLLLDRLELAIGQAEREDCKLAVMYLDLDHFKQVNDSLGHAVGDALLQEAARRMKACVRAVDTVARMGGDEFVVLVPQVHAVSDVLGVAQKMLSALLPPYELEGQSLVCGPSVGISIYPDDSPDLELLIRHADAAMYRVKQSGRANFRLYQDLD